MEKLSKIIENKKLSRDYRCSYEFQAYGNRLAEELRDTKHRTLYIKLAKNEDRSLLEEARAFVLNSKKQLLKENYLCGNSLNLKKKKRKENKINLTNKINLMNFSLEVVCKICPLF